MRAALRDAKIEAAKAASQPKPTTTLAERRKQRWAEKHQGWRRVPGDKMDNSQRRYRRQIEALAVAKDDRRFSGRRWVRLRKALRRQERDQQRETERRAA